MMTDNQYKVARNAIERDLKVANRLGCTITATKLRNALRTLENKFLKPDATGFEAMDITKNHSTSTRYI